MHIVAQNITALAALLATIIPLNQAIAIQTTAQAFKKQTSSVGMFPAVTEPWRTHYDGVKASATLAYDKMLLVDQNHVFGLKHADGLINLECGDDGYSITIVIPHTFTNLRVPGAVNVQIDGAQYRFFHTGGTFGADQSTLTKAEFNAILKSIYAPYLERMWSLRVDEKNLGITLSTGYQWYGMDAGSAQDAIGLVRSACW
jgi:hypothetical protein